MVGIFVHKFLCLLDDFFLNQAFKGNDLISYHLPVALQKSSICSYSTSCLFERIHLKALLLLFSIVW